MTLQVWDIGGQAIGGKMLDNYIYGAHVSSSYLGISVLYPPPPLPPALVRDCAIISVCLCCNNDLPCTVGAVGV